LPVTVILFALSSLSCEFVLDPVAFVLKRAETELAFLALTFFLFMELLPKALLLICKFLLSLVTHILHETLLLNYLIFFQLP
jgi:hypothetical protein